MRPVARATWARATHAPCRFAGGRRHILRLWHVRCSSCAAPAARAVPAQRRGVRAPGVPFGGRRGLPPSPRLRRSCFSTIAPTDRPGSAPSTPTGSAAPPAGRRARESAASARRSSTTAHRRTRPRPIECGCPIRRGRMPGVAERAPRRAAPPQPPPQAAARPPASDADDAIVALARRLTTPVDAPALVRGGVLRQRRQWWRVGWRRWYEVLDPARLPESARCQIAAVHAAPDGVLVRFARPNRVAARLYAELTGA